MYDNSHVKKKSRVLKTEDFINVKYIGHLGTTPYNEVHFYDGRKIIVSYSLSYWASLTPSNFVRINKKLLVNMNVVDSYDSNNEKLILKCGTSLHFSNRQCNQILEKYDYFDNILGVSDNRKQA